jgi:hypothetical protein
VTLGLGRAIDELRDDRFGLGDLAAPVILGDDDALVQRLPNGRFEGQSILATGFAEQAPARPRR